MKYIYLGAAEAITYDMTTFRYSVSEGWGDSNYGIEERRAWCNENFGDISWENTDHGKIRINLDSLWSYETFRENVTYYFRREDHALLFKLRWIAG